MTERLEDPTIHLRRDEQSDGVDAEIERLRLERDRAHNRAEIYRDEIELLKGDIDNAAAEAAVLQRSLIESGNAKKMLDTLAAEKARAERLHAALSGLMPFIEEDFPTDGESVITVTWPYLEAYRAARSALSEKEGGT